MSMLGALPVTSLALANEVHARHEAAQARTTRRVANTLGAANEDKAAKAAAARSPSDALGSLAVATTVAALMSSMPAALHAMTHAGVSSGRDKHGSAAHSISQDSDTQFPQRVTSPGGSTGSGRQAGSSSSGQRGDSSSGEGFSGDADGAQAPQTAANMALAELQLSGTTPMAVPTANANPAMASAVAALAVQARPAHESGTQASQVVEDAPSASPSRLSGVAVRQALALFRQNTSSMRIPMPVVAIVA